MKKLSLAAILLLTGCAVLKPFAAQLLRSSRPTQRVVVEVEHAESEPSVSTEAVLAELRQMAERLEALLDTLSKNTERE